MLDKHTNPCGRAYIYSNNLHAANNSVRMMSVNNLLSPGNGYIAR